MMVSFYVTASSEKDERKTRCSPCLLEARDTVRVPIFKFERPIFARARVIRKEPKGGDGRCPEVRGQRRLIPA